MASLKKPHDDVMAERWSHLKVLLFTCLARGLGGLKALDCRQNEESTGGLPLWLGLLYSMVALSIVEPLLFSFGAGDCIW